MAVIARKAEDRCARYIQHGKTNSKISKTVHTSQILLLLLLLLLLL